ncbi:MAG: Crp/Fnr family transcriptional regulator [Bacteroidota bacterium]
MLEKFKDKIESYVTISDAFLEELKMTCQPRKVKKNEILVKYGGTYHKIFFVAKGGFKSSLQTPEGIKKTTWFYFDDLFNIIPVKDSFLSGKPTKYEIEAIEHSEVLEISMDAIQAWLTKFSEFNTFFRYDMIKDFILVEEIRTHQICYPKDYFLKYLYENFPIIVNRAPSQAVADFMGITPEWYSKLKKKLNKPHKY